MAVKPIDPEVREIYDRMSQAERTLLDAELVAKGRTLADLIPTDPNGRNPHQIDRRCLTNTHSKASKRAAQARYEVRQKRAKDREIVQPKAKDSPSSTKGEGLAKGQDLQKYIQSELGDGRELADFYLRILRMAGLDAIKNGVWLKHRMDAAMWLADRGWGKAKGDESKDTGISINVTNYADAQIAPAPRVRTVDGTVSELDFKGPAKFDADIVVEETKFISEPNQQAGVVNGEAKETKTSSVLVERLDENFQPEEVNVDDDKPSGPPRRTIK